MKKVLLFAITAWVCLCVPVSGQVSQVPNAVVASGGMTKQEEAEVLLNSGIQAFQAGLYKEALAKMEQVRELLNNTAFPQVLFVEGACHFNMGDYAKAISVLEEYTKNYPDGEHINQASMALGRAYINQGQADKGIALLKQVVSRDMSLKPSAGLFVAEALRKQGKTDEALAVLRSVLADGIQGSEHIQATMLAAEIYVDAGKLEEATAMMEHVKNIASSSEDVAQMNNIYLQLGDQMLARKDFKRALGAYHMVRKKSEIVQLQKESVTRIEESLNNPGKGPILGTKEELEARLRSHKEWQAEVEKRTAYDAVLYYRLGRCYLEMGRYWEALLAFEVIVEEFKEFAERDDCLFGMIVANQNLQRVAKARQLCERYLEEFPGGSNLDKVSEMYGMLAYEKGDFQAAIDSFAKAESFPKADKERLRFLRGCVLFEMQRYKEARVIFEALRKDNPKSAYLDDVMYRIALSYFYQGESVSTRKALRDYIKEMSKGNFVTDARYRLAFINFQDQKLDEAKAELDGMVKDAPDDQNIGQVYALLGDIYGQKAEKDKALENYSLAFRKGMTDEVQSYAMEQITGIYQESAKWKELGDLWEGYLKDNRENDEKSLKAIYWISRARLRDNKPEEAVKMLANAIKPKITIAENQQVELLIQQLVALSAPKKRRTATSTAVSAGKAEAGKGRSNVAPQQTADGIEKSLEELLTPPVTEMNNVAQMRILFAKAWLGKAMRDSARMDRFLGIIAGVAKPEDLSPMLLSLVGDHARKVGELDKAAAFYARLNKVFKSSEYADGAAVGLAEIAYEKGNFEQALELFNQALEGYSSSFRIVDANLGKAKALFKLKKYDEADKLYEKIGNVREWRGEAHAMALFMRGEIQFAQKEWNKAIAFYQRVYIAHQKWKPLVAKAYLQCARAFLNRNGPANPPLQEYPDREAARITLTEMVNRKDLVNLPEIREAQQELSKL